MTLIQQSISSLKAVKTSDTMESNPQKREEGRICICRCPFVNTDLTSRVVIRFVNIDG